MFTATLIASDRLFAGDVAAAADAIDQQGRVRSWGWIDQGEAADIRFEEAPGWAAQALEPWRDRADIVVQPTATRAKSLLVADMDSTMITVECIDELADYAGIQAEVAAVTEAAMRGELDFEQALDSRVALLAGMEEAAIDRCLAERVRIMPGAEALVRTMRARGAHCVLVSGGFTRFAEPVAARIGFDRAIANRLLVEGGRLTGKVAKPIVGAETKLQTLEAAIAALGIAREASLAVGDGANDLPMVEAAGLGVAYHAKPVVAAAAAARIDHGDLSALLWAQGIPRGEWIAA